MTVEAYLSHAFRLYPIFKFLFLSMVNLLLFFGPRPLVWNTFRENTTTNFSAASLQRKHNIQELSNIFSLFYSWFKYQNIIFGLNSPLNNKPTFKVFYSSRYDFREINLRPFLHLITLRYKKQDLCKQLCKQLSKQLLR